MSIWPRTITGKLDQLAVALTCLLKRPFEELPAQSAPTHSLVHADGFDLSSPCAPMRNIRNERKLESTDHLFISHSDGKKLVRVCVDGLKRSCVGTLKRKTAIFSNSPQGVICQQQNN